MSETALVAACMTVLHCRGCVIWRQNQGGVSAEYKGRKRFIQFTRGQKGVSDIIGLLPGGRFLAVEAKVGRNKPTEDQAAFLAKVNAAGGLGIVVYSVDELIAKLDAA